MVRRVAETEKLYDSNSLCYTVNVSEENDNGESEK